MKYIFRITPMGAVRMTKADAWKDRDVVLRYRAFRDELKAKARNAGFIPSDQMRVWFYLPMPKSWSKRKRDEMVGKPHMQKPDRDNLEKAFLDALLEQDSFVWHGEQFKYWTDDPIGRIEVEKL